MTYQLISSRQTNPTTSKTSKNNNAQVTLNFWGVYDDPSTFQPIIAAYQAQHPNVKINYTRQDASLYEFVSINLLASQEGPDVWLIPSEWLPKHRDKLSALPEGIIAQQEGKIPKTSGFLSKQPPIPTNAELYAKVYAPITEDTNVLPLSVDTLGLYANPTLLSNAGVKELPIAWDATIAAVKQLAKRDGLNLTQPAINLGTSNNVSRASDILATLMIQNHTPMVSTDKSPTKIEALYNQAITKSTGEPIQPGPAALDFYTSFARPDKEVFSWNAAQPQDFDLFTQGKLPFMIDYSYRVRDIMQKVPTLEFATAGLPQIALTEEPKATMSTSLMVGVPTVSKNQTQAWDFVKFLTDEQNSLAYSRASGRPPARLSLIQHPEAFEPHLRPFIGQTSFATTWYRNEINKTDTIFKQGIDAALSGQSLNDVIAKITKQQTHIFRNEPYE